MNDSRPPEPSSWRSWAVVMIAAAILSGPVIPRLMDRAEQRGRDQNAGQSTPGSPAVAQSRLAEPTPGPPPSQPAPAPAPAPTPHLPEPQPSVAGPPDTDALPVQMTRLLAPAELAGKSRWELDIMRNEIYARHGRRFARDDLQRYFDGQTWYHGIYTPEQFSEARLSWVERTNANLIRDYQNALP